MTSDLRYVQYCVIHNDCEKIMEIKYSYYKPLTLKASSYRVRLGNISFFFYKNRHVQRFTATGRFRIHRQLEFKERISMLTL